MLHSRYPRVLKSEKAPIARNDPPSFAMFF